MRKITISEELAVKVPGLQLSCIGCDLFFQEINPPLWSEIEFEIARLAASVSLENISGMPEIAASRNAYKV